jgi:hypothetical protein
MAKLRRGLMLMFVLGFLVVHVMRVVINLDTGSPEFLLNLESGLGRVIMDIFSKLTVGGPKLLLIRHFIIYLS